MGGTASQAGWNGKGGAHRRHRNSSFRHPSGCRICQSERPGRGDAELRLEGFRDNLCEANAPGHKFRTFLRFSPSRSTSPMIFSLCPLPYMVAVSHTVHPCVVLPSVSYGSAGGSRTRRPSLRANAQFRSPCAKSPCSLRRLACRMRSSSLRQRRSSATLRQGGGESALERTHRAEAWQRQLGTVSESSCFRHASKSKSGSRGWGENAGRDVKRLKLASESGGSLVRHVRVCKRCIGSEADL